MHAGIEKGKELFVSKVLVAGGSGFIASHTILQLLGAGHQVRTTVRSLSREGDVSAMLKRGGGSERLLSDRVVVAPFSGCENH